MQIANLMNNYTNVSEERAAVIIHIFKYKYIIYLGFNSQEMRGEGGM